MRGGRLRRDLRASCGDAVAFGGMVGCGETYLVAFALAIGLSELTAGMVGSLPMVVGGVLQMVSPRVIRWLGSHKRWVLCCALIQALTFVPLALAAYWETISGWALLWIVGVYWGAGLATGPAWNTWIGTIVPRPIRARYFALRTRASQVAVFAGFLIGGVVLHWATASDRVLSTYAMLFVVALVFRLISVALLMRQSEPMPIPPNMRSIPVGELLNHLRGHSGGKLLLYLAAVQAAAQLSGPYFTPYMFEKLKLSYGEFVILLSVAFLARVLSLPLWGHLAHRIGARRLLWLGGIGIVPLSAGWILSGSMPWLITLQIGAGVAWAAYELAFFLLFFDSIAVEERTSVLTLHNLINTLAFVSGALVGGVILQSMGASYTGYLMIFGLSSVGRLAALMLLARVPAIEMHNEEIGLRTMSVRPNSASMDAPVVASLSDEGAESQLYDDLSGEADEDDFQSLGQPGFSDIEQPSASPELTSKH